MKKRIIQISDLHLSREYPLFLHNWQIITHVIRNLAPDLVVVSGDLSLAEPDRLDDLVFAGEQLKALGVPILAIPGNHDIGEGGPAAEGKFGEQKNVTSKRIGHFRQTIGPDFWHHKIGGWRLIGINSQLFGTGLPEEKDQFDFLLDLLPPAEKNNLIVFTHKPLFSQAQGCGDPGRGIPETESAWLRGIVHKAGGRLILSGHMHRMKSYVEHDITHAWAPSTAFISSHPSHDNRGGQARIGVQLIDLDEAGYTLNFADDFRLITHDIRNWVLPNSNALWTIVTEPSAIVPRVGVDAVS